MMGVDVRVGARIDEYPVGGLNVADAGIACKLVEAKERRKQTAMAWCATDAVSR